MMYRGRISHIKIRIISHDWDDDEKIRQKIRELIESVPEKLRKHIILKEGVSKGVISGELKVYEIESNNRRVIWYLIKKIFENVDKNKLMRNMNFDENYAIYIRLNKYDFIEKGVSTPQYEEDSVYIKLSFDMFHKNKEKVIEELHKYLESIKDI